MEPTLHDIELMEIALENHLDCMEQEQEDLRNQLAEAKKEVGLCIS